MPFLAIHKTTVWFNHNKIQPSLISDNIAIKALDFLIRGFKGPFLLALTPIWDGPLFPLAANIAVSSILSETKGEIKMGPL